MSIFRGNVDYVYSWKTNLIDVTFERYSSHLKGRYSFRTFSPVEELLPVVHCRAEKNAGRSNERRNMQKRHVTQKERCVRLVHGGYISRVLRGKTQGIVGPRACTQAP